MGMKGIWDKIKHPEKYGPEKVEEQEEVKERIGACKHVLEGRCQLHNVTANDGCRCSRWS